MARTSFKDQALAAVAGVETVQEAVEALVAAGWRPGKGAAEPTAEDAAAALDRLADGLLEPPSFGALREQGAAYRTAASQIRALIRGNEL